MNSFVINANNFLSKNTTCYYHTDYIKFKAPNNPDYLNYLKNTFNNCDLQILQNASKELFDVLIKDIALLLEILKWEKTTISVVPRSKANLHKNQLLFSSTVKRVITSLQTEYSIEDGTNYITRIKNTYTTHLKNSISNNDGSKPYSGITIDTCDISPNIKNKNIILIDDIYTKSVNIDEDAIETLYKNNANNIIMYVVGKTIEKQQIFK